MTGHLHKTPVTFDTYKYNLPVLLGKASSVRWFIMLTELLQVRLKTSICQLSSLEQDGTEFR